MESAFLSLREALLKLTLQNYWWDSWQFSVSFRTYGNDAIIAAISFLGTRRNDRGPYKASKLGGLPQPWF
jgi:hypothetical protein